MARAPLTTVKWLSDVEDHDYPAAQSYLGLLYSTARVAEIIKGLRSAPMVQFKSKDIFRASGLSLLGVSNSHVEKDRKRIRNGDGLAPLLLVRDEKNGRVVIADGYHRLCAVYEFDEDVLIHCKIV
jgi:disulfide oxidoreductase YuzD